MLRRPVLGLLLASLGCGGCRHQFPVISTTDGRSTTEGGVAADGRGDLDWSSEPGRDRLDGVRPDTGRDPDQPALQKDGPAGPLVTWHHSTAPTSTVTGACKSSSISGGGGVCPSGGITGLQPDAQQLTYGTSCGGPGAEVYYACAGSIGKVTVFASGSATAACGAGALLKLVGGGCACPQTGRLVASYPDPKTQTWVCGCTSGAPLSYAICASPPPGVKLLYTDASCLGPEIVVSGGCSCPPATPLRKSFPESLPWPLLWKCECDGGSPMPYVICGL